MILILDGDRKRGEETQKRLFCFLKMIYCFINFFYCRFEFFTCEFKIS